LLVEMSFVVSLFIQIFRNKTLNFYHNLCKLKDAESAPITDPTFWTFNIWDPAVSSTTTTTTTPPTSHTVTTRVISTTSVNTLVSFEWQIFFAALYIIYSEDCFSFLQLTTTGIAVTSSIISNNTIMSTTTTSETTSTNLLHLTCHISLYFSLVRRHYYN
jgi:hypothetical protein